MAMVQSVVVMMAAAPSILPRAELPSLSRLSPAPLLRSLGLGRQWDSVNLSLSLSLSPPLLAAILFIFEVLGVFDSPLTFRFSQKVPKTQ